MRNPCLGCGVCCMQYRVSFHWMETTAHPFGTVPVELTVPLRRHEVAMRGTDSASPYCIALAGVPKVDAYCAIHGNHPSCCREVAVGSEQCLKARRAHGMPDLDQPPDDLDPSPSPDLPQAA